MKEIPLTQGHVALVDDRDYARVSKHHWSFEDRGKYGGYAKGSVNGKMVRMHRFILGLPSGKGFVDHKRDGLDNRRSNLRVATKRQNAQHRRKLTIGTSKYKGASLHNGKWRMQIMVTYDSEVEAAKAYDVVAKALYGKFARTNFGS